MLIIITEGELVWDKTTNDYDWQRTTALPRNLHNQFKGEPLHVDLRWTKTENKLSLKNPQFRNAIYLMHPAEVMSLVYDPTGKYIATPCVDGFVRVWDALDGKEIAHLKRDVWVYEVAFSPDGQYVAASSGNPELLAGQSGMGLAAIWEWRTGREIGHLRSNNLITTLSFSPDDKLLAVGGIDGIVHILRTSEAFNSSRMMIRYTRSPSVTMGATWLPVAEGRRKILLQRKV